MFDCQWCQPSHQLIVLREVREDAICHALLLLVSYNIVKSLVAIFIISCQYWLCKYWTLNLRPNYNRDTLMVLSKNKVLSLDFGAMFVFIILFIMFVYHSPCVQLSISTVVGKTAAFQHVWRNTFCSHN